VQRQQDHGNRRLDHRGEAAKGERAGHGVHDGECHHHVQEHLTHAFGCDNHAVNIGMPRPGHQLEEVMRAFEAAYRRT
jgi:hypothetical protein